MVEFPIPVVEEMEGNMNTNGGAASETASALQLPDIYPRLAYNDERAALESLQRVFQFEEIREARFEQGEFLLAWLRVGSGVVMIGRGDPKTHQIQSPQTLGGASVQMMVSVQDIDAHYRHAVAEAADITMPIEDASYGERRYEATDLEGHRWHFGARILDRKAAES